MIRTDVLLLVPAFLLLAGIAANFSALETALFALREKGGAPPNFQQGGRSTLSTLFRDALGSLPEVLLIGCLSNLLLAATGLYLIVEPLQDAGWNRWLSAAVIFGGGLLMVELLPRTLALRSPSRVAELTMPLFLIFRKVLAPFSAPLHATTECLVSRITPRKLKPLPVLSQEEVDTLIDMRAETGGITPDEATLLHAIATLPGLSVKDCMTPRVDLPLMPFDSKDEEAAHMLEATRHRHVAVFDMKLDAIVYLVDTLEWKLSGRPHWSTLTKPPIFVPESLSLIEAWSHHLQDDTGVIVVVDEYGGFCGLLPRTNVTDYLLAKVAPTQNGALSLQALSPGRYLAAGNTRLEEIENELDVEFGDTSIGTIGGLVLNHFGYPPKPGESFTLGKLTIKVKRTLRARIQQLEIRVQQDQEATDS